MGKQPHAWRASECGNRKSAEGSPGRHDNQPVADQPKVVNNSIHDFTESAGSHHHRHGSFLPFPRILERHRSCPLHPGRRLWLLHFHEMAGDRPSPRIFGILIVSLGLLVDDAIIVIEMMQVKLEEGMDRMAAAEAAHKGCAKPMLAGTLITAAGFIPVGLAQDRLPNIPPPSSGSSARHS